MSMNYTAIIKERLDLLNSLENVSHTHQYRVKRYGSYNRYAVFYGDSKKLSGYIGLSTVCEWLGGYLQAVRDMHDQTAGEVGRCPFCNVEKFGNEDTWALHLEICVSMAE